MKLLLTLLAILLWLALLVGCNEEPKVKADKVSYDDHIFIRFNPRTHGQAVLHHPDCPCGKAKD